MSFLTLQPILAVGVTPELNISTVVGAVALLAIAVWFAIVSYDIATGFRRFDELDQPKRAVTPKKERTESDERELIPAGRASPR